MTAQDIIKGALRLIAVIQPGEDLSASEAADGLAALNQMLHQWPMDLQHEDLALTDTLRVPPDHLRAIRYNLAFEVAPEFGKQIPASVAMTADKTYRQIENEYANPARLDSRLNRFDRYDINRDF